MKETIKVAGMTCGCCVGKVENRIHELDGISSIKIDLDKSEVQVDFSDAAVSLDEIKDKIKREGYQVD
ncbi:heavy-metal-associated domain-containing protein [Ornithinibacillus gellani]|uniref:heavy-metal-associated domain-containing protein n=1 Tax=Ornithinibacillus gellani TaxID=2293253 RepID=UPI000F46B46D|nr:heavy metal-associated domain-containing protein [Ornithinibacillus gellani]TQS70522.1 heavy-metal-associated domain-containing protein [Ornithinibacillus gellani]